jgi:hypothetical protein
MQLLYLAPESEHYLFQLTKERSAPYEDNAFTASSSSDKDAFSFWSISELDANIETKWGQLCLLKSDLVVDRRQRSTLDVSSIGAWVDLDVSWAEVMGMNPLESIFSLAKNGHVIEALSIARLLEKSVIAVRTMPDTSCRGNLNAINECRDLCAYSLSYFASAAAEAASTLFSKAGSLSSQEMQSLVEAVNRMMCMLQSMRLYSADCDFGVSLQENRAGSEFAQSGFKVDWPASGPNNACCWLQSQCWSLVINVLSLMDSSAAGHSMHVAAVSCLVEHFPHCEVPEQLIQSFVGLKSEDQGILKNASGWYQLMELLLKHQKPAAACAVSARLLKLYIDASNKSLDSSDISVKTGEFAVPYTLFDRVIISCDEFVKSRGADPKMSAVVSQETAIFKALLEKYFALLMIRGLS